MRSRYSRNAVDRINRVIKTAHEHLKLSLTCLKLHKKKKNKKENGMYLLQSRENLGM